MQPTEQSSATRGVRRSQRLRWWGPRGSVWACAAAAVLAPAAAVSGAAYLTYQQDLYSLLMALGFGGVMLCYAISLYLLSPPTGTTAAQASRTPAPPE